MNAKTTQKKASDQIELGLFMINKLVADHGDQHRWMSRVAHHPVCRTSTLDPSLFASYYSSSSSSKDPWIGLTLLVVPRMAVTTGYLWYSCTLYPQPSSDICIPSSSLRAIKSSPSLGAIKSACYSSSFSFSSASPSSFSGIIMCTNIIPSFKHQNF